MLEFPSSVSKKKQQTPFEEYIQGPLGAAWDLISSGYEQSPLNPLFGKELLGKAKGAYEWWDTPRAASPTELEQHLAKFKEYQAAGEADPSPTPGFQQVEDLRRLNNEFTPDPLPLDPLEEAIARVRAGSDAEYNALRPTDYTYVDGERVDDATRISERFQTDDDLERYKATPDYQRRVAQASGLAQTQAAARMAQAQATGGSAAMGAASRAASRAQPYTDAEAESRGYNPIDYGKINYDDDEAQVQRQTQMQSQYAIALMQAKARVAAAQIGVRPNQLTELQEKIVPRLMQMEKLTYNDALMRFFSLMAGVEAGYVDTEAQAPGQPVGQPVG